MGDRYSAFMSRYYADESGIGRLLRPRIEDEDAWEEDGNRLHSLLPVWDGLYAGVLVADDILQLANDRRIKALSVLPENGFLGNHDPNDGAGDEDGAVACDEVEGALERAMRSMNGEGIWRSPKDRGVGTNAYQNRVTASDEALERWRRETYRVLKRYLTPDPKAPRSVVGMQDSHLPILNSSDRRAFARSLWNPLIPEVVWQTSRVSSSGSAQVYLDVSGSMYAEMPLIIGLLIRLGGYIRRPFWAFSDVVAPASIRDNQLVADTTGGTTMSCVLEHLVQTRPPAAVVITDGYIEPLDRRLVRRTNKTRLHAIVTRDGSSQWLRNAGISYTQLGRIPG
jgi:hypothetical protein